MNESQEQPDAQSDAGANSEAETDATGRPHPASGEAQPDSANFERCSTCVHAGGVDGNAGTLHCKKHDMYVNAEADEIPDDCVEYEAGGETGERR